MDHRYAEVELCDELLGWADFSVGSFPRFREACVEVIEPWIVVRTRTGGGNRGEYSDEIDHVKLLPHFDHEQDDDYDRTYMYFWYRVPKKSMGKWRDFANKTEEEFPDNYHGSSSDSEDKKGSSDGSSSDSSSSD